MINDEGLIEEVEAIVRAGYEAYSQSTGNKNYRGEEMPKWEDLPEKIQNAWIAAAERICHLYGGIVARSVTKGLSE